MVHKGNETKHLKCYKQLVTPFEIFKMVISCIEKKLSPLEDSEQTFIHIFLSLFVV